jgi:outer membrane immunogenic protein
MNKWRAGFLGLTLSSTLVLSANAADTYRGGLKDGPPPPVYVAAPIWSGFYVGVNGGYGWTANDGVVAGYGGTPNDGVLSPSGGFGGGQIGYNWQGLFGYSPWVIGIEADIQGAGISDSANFADGEHLQNSLNWFGTVRGRLGYAFGPALLYATGGFAYGEVESKWAGGPFGFDVTETQTGYVVGGGLEYKFNPAWSVKGEYQFINLDANNWNGAGALNGSIFSDRSEVNTFRVGLNYTLGHGGFGPLN